MTPEPLSVLGALKTLGANKDLALPIKLFELSDVILLAPEKEVGSKNQRQLVAVYCSKDSGFEVIHGLLNRVMEIMGVPLRQGKHNCSLRFVLKGVDTRCCWLSTDTGQCSGLG